MELGGYQEERQVSLEIDLEPDDYIILPTTFSPDINAKFNLTVWSAMAKGKSQILLGEI